MQRDEPEAKVPADLRKVFAAAPKAKAQWNDLTPLARQDFIMWIDRPNNQKHVNAGSRASLVGLPRESGVRAVLQ